MYICHQENLKLKQIQMSFQMHQFFGEIVSRQEVQLDPQKLHTLTEINNKKELQSCLGILNYSGNISPSTAEVYEPSTN